MSLSPFCHILCGEGGGAQSTVLYYPFLFPSVKLLNVDVRRNESLLFIAIFEVLNLNDYKTTKYCPSEI